MMMTLGSSLVMSWIFYNWAILGFQLFTDDAAVTEIGIHMMQYLCPFYITYVAVEVFSGTLRGGGRLLDADDFVPVWRLHPSKRLDLGGG